MQPYEYLKSNKRSYKFKRIQIAFLEVNCYTSCLPEAKPRLLIINCPNISKTELLEFYSQWLLNNFLTKDKSIQCILC